MFPPIQNPSSFLSSLPRMPWRRARARPTRPRQAPSVGRPSLRPSKSPGTTGQDLLLQDCKNCLRLVRRKQPAVQSVKGRSSILWRLWQCRSACILVASLHARCTEDIFIHELCGTRCCALPACWVMIKAAARLPRPVPGLHIISLTGWLDHFPPTPIGAKSRVSR